MTVKTRLILLSLLASAGVLLVGLFSLFTLSQFNRDLNGVLDRIETGLWSVNDGQVLVPIHADQRNPERRRSLVHVPVQ